MPWFEYVCEKCGQRVQRPRPVAYRNVAPRHNDEDACWDGTLRLLTPVRGPGGPRSAARPLRPEQPEQAGARQG